MFPNQGFFDALGKSHPKLERGRVWCTTCGKAVVVNSGDCLRKGWPKCCGQTMTLDSPDERKSFGSAEEGGES